MKQEIFVARYVYLTVDEMPLSSTEFIFSTKEKAIEHVQSEIDEGVWYDDIEEEAHGTAEYPNPEYNETDEGWHIYSTVID